jgi:glycosyltransferase involved in cell wall biosynthesis
MNKLVDIENLKIKRNRRNHILFIAPLPPPITGMALMDEGALLAFQREMTVDVVNLSKPTFRQGIDSLNRIKSVLRIFTRIIRLRQRCGVAYLALSQSLPGNLKDLVILLLLCGRNTVVHLHGGGIKEILFDPFPWLRYINKLVLKRVQTAIVLGESLIPVFDGVIPKTKTMVIKNFASDELFLTEAQIHEKWQGTVPKFLFMSNLLPGKGYLELAKAGIILSKTGTRPFVIQFRGGFEDENDKRNFLHLIEPFPNIEYSDTVRGVQRQDAYRNSHFFCLPSYYPYEGQPVSILEGYASGCVVLSTRQGGIPDVFRGGINGFEVKAASVDSLVTTLRLMIHHFDVVRDKLRLIAYRNASTARRYYRKERFDRELLAAIKKRK